MQLDDDSSSDQGNLLEAFVSNKQVHAQPQQQQLDEQMAKFKSLNLKNNKSALADSKNKLKRQ